MPLDIFQIKMGPEQMGIYPTSYNMRLENFKAWGVLLGWVVSTTPRSTWNLRRWPDSAVGSLQAWWWRWVYTNQGGPGIFLRKSGREPLREEGPVKKEAEMVVMLPQTTKDCQEHLCLGKGMGRSSQRLPKEHTWHLDFGHWASWTMIEYMSVLTSF